MQYNNDNNNFDYLKNLDNQIDSIQNDINTLNQMKKAEIDQTILTKKITDYKLNKKRYNYDNLKPEQPAKRQINPTINKNWLENNNYKPNTKVFFKDKISNQKRSNIQELRSKYIDISEHINSNMEENLIDNFMENDFINFI